MSVPKLKPCSVFAVSSRGSRRGDRVGDCFPRRFSLSLPVLAGARFSAREPDEYEDFAEIFVDQYFGPDDKLDLSAAGEERAEALAHYSRGIEF